MWLGAGKEEFSAWKQQGAGGFETRLPKFLHTQKGSKLPTLSPNSFFSDLKIQLFQAALKHLHFIYNLFRKREQMACDNTFQKVNVKIYKFLWFLVRLHSKNHNLSRERQYDFSHSNTPVVRFHLTDFDYPNMNDQNFSKDFFEYLSLSLAYLIIFFFWNMTVPLLSLNISNGHHTLHLMKQFATLITS